MSEERDKDRVELTYERIIDGLRKDVEIQSSRARAYERKYLEANNDLKKWRQDREVIISEIHDLSYDLEHRFMGAVEKISARTKDIAEIHKAISAMSHKIESISSEVRRIYRSFKIHHKATTKSIIGSVEEEALKEKPKKVGKKKSVSRRRSNTE